MNTTQLMLIDISGLAHATFHVSGSEPDPNFISTKLIERVRAIASQHPHAAIACDSGKSFRHDIDPQYKAGRDTENRAVLYHQLGMALDVLRKDGFPVWSAKGWEADDIIGTATAQALTMDPDVSVVIVSDDKDLTQLISERVTRRKFDGTIVDEATVRERLKIAPAMMHDYLCLVGDASDNVKGAKGIGGVTAAKLLNAHGSIAAIYEAMQHGVVKELTPSLRSSMVEFQDRWPTVAQLIALRTDAPIPFEEIATERTAAPMEVEMAEPFKQGDDSNDAPLPWSDDREREAFRDVMHKASAPPEDRELNQSESLAALNQATAKVAERINAPKQETRQELHPGRIVGEQGMATIAPSAPVEFTQQLEPRSMNEAIQLAQRMYDSRLFSAYGTPQAVLSTILAGRELGIPAMASLRAFHIIEGKPQMSAGTIQSLVLKSGRAVYFRCTERTATKATFCTKRGDDPEMCLTYTIEEGRAAWPKDENAWNKSGWGRNPADMLVARASSKLARLVYPDVVSGLYSPEEFD